MGASVVASDDNAPSGRSAQRPLPGAAGRRREPVAPALEHAPAHGTDLLDEPVRFGAANPALLALLRQLRLLARDSEGTFISLHRGQVVCDRDEIFQYVYFPLTARFAYECVLDDGRSIELASAGDDSFAGWPLITGGNSMPFRTTVSVAGMAFCCTASALSACLLAEPSLETRMLDCIHVLFAEISQRAACIKLHTVDQQVACCLLTLHDRSAYTTLDISAASLARALGVTDRSVRSALRRLVSDGIVASPRGAVSILDRARLEARSCECYRVLRSFYRHPQGDGTR
ncbi:CRP-like cAMP-binding protein [Paraburkholderia sp. GAS448]|uniref:Crp/Fnr family transcriptional regulator n=1 Tax=Paraburkholderia sp. GAS448 TaxID=3035136 RepID=UPI003D242F90